MIGATEIAVINNQQYRFIEWLQICRRNSDEIKFYKYMELEERKYWFNEDNVKSKLADNLNPLTIKDI